MTPAELRAWRDRRYAGRKGKNEAMAFDLGLAPQQLARRLFGHTPISRTEELLIAALGELDELRRVRNAADRLTTALAVP